MEVELDLWSSRSNDQVDHILDDVDCCDIPGEVDEFILAGCSSNHSSHSQHMVDLDGKADLSSTGPVDSMASNHHHHHHQFHHHHQLGFYDEPNSSFQLIPQRDQHHQHLQQQHQQQQQEPQQQIQYQRANPNNQSSSSSSTSSSSVSPTEEVDYCDVDLSQLTNSNHIGLGQQHHLGGHYVGQHQQHPQQQFASPTPVSFISQQQAAGNQLHYNTSATSGVSNESLVASRVDHCYILNDTSQQVVASLGAPHDHQLQQVANISSSTGCNALPDREQMQMLLESKPQPIPSLMTNTNPNVSKQQNPSPSQTGGRKRRQTNGGQAKRARQQVKCNSKETPVTVSTNLSDTKNTQKQSNDKASKVASSSSSAKAASTTKKTGETRQQPASSSGEKQTSPSNDTKNIRRNQSKSPTSNRAASSTSSFTTSSTGNSGQVSPTLSSCSSSGVSSLSSLSFSSGSPTNSCDEPNSNDEPSSIASSEQQLVAASTCGRGVKKPRQTKVVVGSSSCPSTSSSSTSSGKVEQEETKAKLAKGLQESPQEAQSAAKHKGENNSTSAPRTIKVEPTGQPTFSLSRMLNQAQQQKRQTNGVSSTTTTTNTNTANRTAPTKTNSIASQLSFEANLSPSSRQKLSNLSSCLIINSQPADQPSTSCLSSSSSSSSSTSASPAPTSSQPASDKHLVGTIVEQPVARGRSSVSSTSSSSSSTSSESQPKALGSPTISQQFSPSIVTFVSSASLSSSSSSSMSSLSSSSNSACSTALTSASHSPASSVSSSPTMQLGLSVSSPGLVGSSCTQRSTTMTTTTSGTTTTTTSTKTSTSTSLASSAALAATMATNLISNQDWKSAQSGQVVVLTEEERRTLVAEGYPIPQRFPLSKAEERSLKKIRRKIKNKISAQESRRKKKEYMEELEKKVQEMELRIAELERQNELLSGGGGGGGGRHDATAIKHKCDQQVDLELNRVIVEQDAELAAAQTATSTAAITSATSQANQQVQTTMNTSSYHSQQQAQQQIQRKNSTQSNLSSSNDDDNFIDDILMSQERQDVDIAQQVGEVDLVANLVGVDGEPEAAQQQQQQQQQVSDIKTGALINVLASFSGQQQETQQQQLVVGLTPSTS